MQYKIHLLGTSRDIINRNTKVNLTIDKTIDLIGNPTYYSTTDVDNRTIPPLPGAEIEVRTIGNLAVKYNWNTSIIIGEAATEDTVKKIINPGILHISTHGFFIDVSQETTDIIEGKATINPLLTSGLIFYNGGERMVGMKINEFNLGDGVLTSYEAMNLNLDKTELVVLSACETGLGELKVGEGVFGLQRALAIAGAKCIVMSLSKVSDEVTTKLMELFYQHLLTGMDKTDAFVQAKKDLMKLYPNPKYWGTFIMVGI